MRLYAAAICLALQGCGFAYDKEIAGPYRLVAVDVLDQMTVCYRLKRGDCVGRINGTVFAWGSDENYIVAARHPDKSRERIEYFYIIRSLDSSPADPSVAVRGPYDLSSYQAEELRLGLPALSRRIRELE